MNIFIPVPEDLIHKMEKKWPDVTRRAQESFAAEAYRAGVITEAEVQRMLNLSSRWDVDAVLKRYRAYLDYTEGDLEEDIQAIEQTIQP